jgi:PPOX class probable F420-dependent enzyme
VTDNIFDLVPATHHDLLESAWAAALVTLDGQSRPQTTAVWYLADAEDGELKVSLSDARLKFKHIQANPEVDVFLVDPANQFRTLEIRGTATISADEGLALAQKVGKKYDADVTSFDQPGDVRHTVTIAARRVVANG